MKSYWGQMWVKFKLKEVPDNSVVFQQPMRTCKEAVEEQDRLDYDDVNYSKVKSGTVVVC